MKTIQKSVVFLLGCVLAVSFSLNAQQLVSAGGGYFAGSQAQISFSVGELEIETFAGVQNRLTQGFQQPGFTMGQTLQVEAGWNGISTWLIPANDDLQGMFQPVMNDLIIVKNMTGVFWPSQNINTLGNWNYKDGYVLKSDSDFQLTIEGYLPNDLSLFCPQGWLLIPVLSRTDVPVLLFGQQNTDVKLIKEVAGCGVYWPSQNIATLEKLEPGKSYYLLMETAGTLTFPIIQKYSKVYDKRSQNIAQHWSNQSNTPVSHIIVFTNQALTGISEDDFIGIFTSDGLCTGQTRMTGWDEKQVIMAFGDDETTHEKDGFFAGETMKFIWFNTADAKEVALTPVFDEEFPDYSGKFAQNGISFIKEFKNGNTGTISNPIPEVNIYPNPCDGVFYISGIPVNSKIRINDLAGQTVFSQLSYFNGSVIVDLSGKPSGIYLVKIEHEGMIITRKIILNQ
jgi:hypothetical protein